MNTAKRIALPAHLSAYLWRPARMDDIPAVCAMLAAGMEIDRPFFPPSEERLAHLYSLLGERLTQDTRLVFAPDGGLVAEAFIFFPSPEDERLALLDGHVHVAHRGRGLASALLAHSLRAFRQAGFSQAALDVDAENPSGALRLYQKLGFCAIRQELHFVKRLP